MKVGGERRKRKHLELFFSPLLLPPPPQDGLRKLKGDSDEGEGGHTEELGSGEKGLGSLGEFFGVLFCFVLKPSVP